MEAVGSKFLTSAIAYNVVEEEVIEMSYMKEMAHLWKRHEHQESVESACISLHTSVCTVLGASGKRTVTALAKPPHGASAAAVRWRRLN